MYGRKQNFFSVMFFCLAFAVLGFDVNAQPTLVIKPENNETGKVALYNFEFTLQDSLTNDGAFVLSLPEGFELVGTTIAASKTITGGLKVLSQERQILVMRQGKGPTLATGKTVDIWLSAIKNAQTPGAASFSLQFFPDGKAGLQQLQAKPGQPILDKPALTGTVNLLLTP